MTTSTSPSVKRIDSLDWLRGLMALAIMTYHLSGMYFTQPDASSFLGRMGIYGVSIFFILSGLSMAIVYHHSMNSIRSIGSFFVRRIFRIWPLLWIATILTVALNYSAKTGIDGYKLWINLTTAFGFIEPRGYIATGAWSIGNEMVYYIFTPVFIFAYNYKKWMGNLLLAITVAIGCYFCFYALSPDIALGKQWKTYINPFNNLFLYTTGIAIFYNFRDVNFTKTENIALLLLTIGALIFYPTTGNQSVLVAGLHRITLVVISSGLVVAFYKFMINIPRFIDYPLEKLGIATYGVYLLHPVVNNGLSKIIKLPTWGMAASVVILTILISQVSYFYFELKLMKLGKKLTSPKTN